MKKNESSVAKKSRSNVVGTVLKVILVLCLAAELLGFAWGILSEVFKVLLPIVGNILILLIVACVIRRIWKKRNAPSIADKYPSLPIKEWREQEAKKRAPIEAKAVSAERVSEELAVIRARYEPDIAACLAGADATWAWAGTPTANVGYVRFSDKPQGVFRGVLSVAAGRVLDIVVTETDGSATHYPNVPFYEAQRAASEAAKVSAAAAAKAREEAFAAAIERFFATRKDGNKAKYSELNAANGSFVLTAPLGKFKVENAKAIAEFNGGNIVAVRVTLADKSVRTIKCGKQTGQPAPLPKPGAHKGTEKPAPGPSAPPVPSPSPAPKSEPPVPKASPAGNKPVGANPSTLNEPVEAKPNPPVEHAPAVDIHQPSNLSPDELQRHVKLVAGAAGATINEAGLAAYNAGEEFCSIEWPEGLHTLEEIEAFAQLEVDTVEAFSSYEIDEPNGLIKLRLGEVNTVAANNLAALAEEMSSDLDRQAAQLYAEENEEWLTIVWPTEVDSVKAAEDFAKLLVGKTNFTDYKVDAAGKIHLHMDWDDEVYA